MSDKRRRSSGGRGGSRPRQGSSDRRPSARTGGRASGREVGAASARSGRTTGSARNADRRAAARARATVPAGTPSVSLSLARGLLSTMASPALVGLTVVSALLLWGAFAAMGEGSIPLVMADSLALPPLHSALDINFLFASARQPGGAVAAIAGFLGLIAFRSLLAVLAVSLARSAQDSVPAATALRRAFGLVPSRLARMMLVESGYVSVALVALFLLYGVLGVFGLVLALLLVVYMGVFVTIAVVLDGASPRDALSASYRASRLVGAGHSYLVSGYLLFVIALAFVAPGRPGVATPTVVVWVYALFAGLLHVAFLSAFVHRWRLLRPLVVAGAAAEDLEPEPAAPA